MLYASVCKISLQSHDLLQNYSAIKTPILAMMEQFDDVSDADSKQ